MKKTTKKLIALALVAMLMTAPACARRDDSSGIGATEKVDKTRTQLNIANGYGGVGDAWLKEVKKQFEAIYAETSFEENKKGVQVIINNKLIGDVKTESVLAKIQDSSDAVWFGEELHYFDLANSGKIADITDIISTPLTEFGEEESILDKLEPYMVDVLKTNDNKYFALPFWEGFYNMYYDVALWEDNLLYFRDGYTTQDMDVFAEDADLESLFIYSLSDKKSAGPDGEYDTIDDGLPITYSDWFAVARYMYYNCGIVPSVWSGTYTHYLIPYAVSLWSNEVGYEAMMQNFTLSGTADNLITIDDDGNITFLGETVINNENGYELQRQSAKYNVLKFIYELVHHSYMYDSLSFGSLSHTGAQDRFLASSNLSNVQTIGTLIEGSWWNNEATSTFNNMADEYGSEWSRQNRRIGVIPPLRSSYEEKQTTLVSVQSAMCFINKKTKGVELELAKLFYRYLHTDTALKTFTKVTGMTRAFDYEIKGEEYDNMFYYAKSMYTMRKDASVLYEVSKNRLISNNPLAFDMFTWSYTSTVGKNVYDNPFVAFHDNSGLTAEEYFSGMYKYQKGVWGNLKK